MPQKVILIADPGIDTAFAIALALHDPNIDVIGLIASAGNVSAEQATQNVHILVNQIDVPKWPRVGSAIPVQYEIDGTKLHGPDGLGGAAFPPFTLHQPLQGDKVIVELVRANPKEVAIVILGPCTMLARALDRDPELPHLIDRIICMGGSWREPGNTSVVAEFHFFCDPLAARQVLHCGAPITLLPLDISRKLTYSPSDLLELPSPESATCQFLRKIVPFGIRASSNLYGIEGFHLKDVLGIAHLALPAAVTTERVCIDVETRGELTRGMSVVDARPHPAGSKNVQIGISVDVVGVRDYINRILKSTE
ncbi:MAG: nucleoside hydrolase [Planctomycetes bacterium]|nr:nucleoside hydrolase [Planctomycetota bacterium]